MEMNNGGLNVPPQQDRIVVTITAVPSSSTSSNMVLQSDIRPPPIVHAIGGTIGSALSILLCYPLERIRVEMMKSATVAAAAATSSSSSPHQIVMTTLESSNNAAEAKSTDNVADEKHPTKNRSLSSSSSSSSSFIAIETPSSYENLSEASTGSSCCNISITSIRPIAVAVASDTMVLCHNDNDSSSPSAMSSSSGGEEQEKVSSLLRNQVSEIPKLKNDDNNDGLSSSTTSWNVEQSNKTNTTYPSPFSNTWSCFLHLCKKQELYTGVVPAICTLAISNFIFFYSHEILRQWLLPIPMLDRSTASNSNNPNHSTNTDGLSTINTTVSTTTITTTTSSSSSSGDSAFSSDYASEILDNATVAAVRRIVSTLSTIIMTTRNNITTKEADDHTRSGGRRNEMTSRDLFLRSFLASAVAGIINVLLTNPLWVANLRILHNTSSSCDTIGNSPTSSSSSNSSANHGQQQHKRRSLLSEVLHIIKHEGIAKLWSGTLTSLLLVSNPSINHFLYEQLRNYILLRARMNLHLRSSSCRHSSSSTPQLRPWETFVLGAFTKAVATVVTYPLQLAQVVLRVQASKESRRHNTTNFPPPHHKEACGGVTYKGTWDCISSLYRKGGWAALYVGMDAKLLQTVLTAAFTFVTYEQILSFVRRGYRTARLLSK